MRETIAFVMFNDSPLRLNRYIYGLAGLRIKSVQLGPAYVRYPIKFILPEFVSYLGERGVLYVGNGSNSCTPVLVINICNITFQVLRLNTLSLTSVQEKNIHDYICG